MSASDLLQPELIDKIYKHDSLMMHHGQIL